MDSLEINTMRKLNNVMFFNPKNLEWANKIIVFEDVHEDILKKYGYTYWGKSYNFGIEDMYHYNQKSLILIIKEKLKYYEFL